jgi:hypothetical protein
MDPCRVSRLVERTTVGEGERERVSKGSEGEAAHLGWVTAHPARARRRGNLTFDYRGNASIV